MTVDTASHLGSAWLSSSSCMCTSAKASLMLDQDLSLPLSLKGRVRRRDGGRVGADSLTGLTLTPHRELRSMSRTDCCVPHDRKTKNL